MGLTLGRLIIILVVLGSVVNQVLYHLGGNSNPFKCKEGWCILTGLIYIFIGGALLVYSIVIIIKYWDTPIKL